MHINLSVRNGGSDPLPQIIAGLMELAPEMTAFLNPTENSYERLGGNRAASRIGWSTRSRSYLLRVPDTNGRRAELRSPDALCNPYLAYALVIYAGLYGIEKNLPLPAKTSAASPEPRTLPATLREAVAVASDSAFIKKCLPSSVIAAYCQRGGSRK